MKTVQQQLIQYAGYHRDKRNILTHLVGIPLIYFAVVSLLSRPELAFMYVPITPALILASLLCLYYLKLHLGLGLVMVAFNACTLFCAHQLSGMATSDWLTISIGAFVIGWVFQFVGHYFEGKKPAFVDDLIGLLIGPLFIVAEVCFALGLFKSLHQDIEAAFSH